MTVARLHLRGRTAWLLVALLLLAVAVVGRGVMSRLAAASVTRSFTGRSDRAVATLISVRDRTGLGDVNYLVYTMRGSTFVQIIALPRDLVVRATGRKLSEELAARTPAKFAAAVGEMVGHRIDHYVIVRMDRVPAFIDRHLPSGIPLLVERTLTYVDRAGGVSYSVKAGDDRRHGSEFVAFCRHRHGDPEGDLGRLKRQKRALQALAAELFKPQNTGALNAMVQDLASTAETDLTPSQALGLAAVFKSVPSLRISQFPGHPSRANANGRYHMVLVPAEIGKTRTRLAARGVWLPDSLALCVLNGTTEAGAARRAGLRLTGALDAVLVEIGDSPIPYNRTRIRYWPTDLREGAHAAAEALGVDGVLQEGRQLQRCGPYLEVVVGSDAVRRLGAASGGK